MPVCIQQNTFSSNATLVSDDLCGSVQIGAVPKRVLRLVIALI